MPDKFSKEVRSHIMSRVRGKNTSLEMFVFSELRKRKVHFQKHYKKAPGSPDLAIPSRKLAIFVDGDFWHGYRYPAWKHKIRQKFWRDKIERNRRRDRRNFAKLRRLGWKYIRVWEHEIKDGRLKATGKISNFLNESGIRPARVRSRRS